MEARDYSRDLCRAYDELSEKQAPIRHLFDYYDGKQALVYSASRLREMFRGLDANFSENWCAPVVDTLLDRVSLAGLTIAGTDRAATQAGERLKLIWTREELELLADDVHSDVAIAGESFVIAWKDAAGLARLYHNAPQLCHVEYSEDEAQGVDFAAKWWTGADKLRKLTLYYPDRFAHFTSRAKAKDVTSADNFMPDGDAFEQPHDAGRVPVFHFRTNRRVIAGELANACRIQDAMNKELADMMTASEFAAIPQRYYIGNASTTGMKAAAHTVVKVPPAAQGEQAAAVGAFPPAQLEPFIAVLERFANAMASITRTPKPSFFQVGGNVSGDALVAMESGLTMKARRYQKRMGSTWRQLAAFALELEGAGQLNPASIEDAWEDSRTVQPLAGAQMVETYVRATVPLKTALKRAGWSAAEIEAMEEDAAGAALSTANMGTLMLDAARRTFDQGNPNAGA